MICFTLCGRAVCLALFMSKSRGVCKVFSLSLAERSLAFIYFVGSSQVKWDRLLFLMNYPQSHFPHCSLCVISGPLCHFMLKICNKKSTRVISTSQHSVLMVKGEQRIEPSFHWIQLFLI